jgi:hypothetical protein
VRARTRELVGFDRATFARDGHRHEVYRAASGPAVVVIHELPGIHPGAVELGRRLVAAGYTVFLPSLFGRPGEPLAAATTLRAVVRVCVAREFAILADRTSPVATWLRALAAEAHGECGGPGVGAIGTEARAPDDVGADERRDDHTVLERHGPAVGEVEDELVGGAELPPAPGRSERRLPPQEAQALT